MYRTIRCQRLLIGLDVLIEGLRGQRILGTHCQSGPVGSTVWFHELLSISLATQQMLVDFQTLGKPRELELLVVPSLTTCTGFPIAYPPRHFCPASLAQTTFFLRDWREQSRWPTSFSRQDFALALTQWVI